MDNIIVISASVIVMLATLYCKKKKKKPQYRVNPYLKDRNIKGRFANDFDDLKKHHFAFHENFHMNANDFENVFLRIEERLLCKRATRKDEIPAKVKFAAVIEYLSSGSLQRHVASTYRISKQHFGTIIDTVCDAIIAEFGKDTPQINKETIKKIAKEFGDKWQFPTCAGALDGKHVPLKAPDKSGSLFYNYKCFFSIVLMAISDANYKFVYFDVGALGSECDANIFATSKFGKSVMSDKIDFPDDMEIDGQQVPYSFLGDGAFPLGKRIMRPFSTKSMSDEQRIFNYRLSRARRCVENAFGVLCTKWLCLKRTMFCSPDRAQKIITACCLLHNYFISTRMSQYCPPSYVDQYDEEGQLILGQWRNEITTDSLINAPSFRNRGRSSLNATIIRNNLMNYFNTIGAIPWQRKSAGLE